MHSPALCALTQQILCALPIQGVFRQIALALLLHRPPMLLLLGTSDRGFFSSPQVVCAHASRPTSPMRRHQIQQYTIRIPCYKFLSQNCAPASRKGHPLYLGKHCGAELREHRQAVSCGRHQKPEPKQLSQIQNGTSTTNPVRKASDFAVRRDFKLQSKSAMSAYNLNTPIRGTNR